MVTKILIKMIKTFFKYNKSQVKFYTQKLTHN